MSPGPRGLTVLSCPGCWPQGCLGLKSAIKDLWCAMEGPCLACAMGCRDGQLVWPLPRTHFQAPPKYTDITFRAQHPDGNLSRESKSLSSGETEILRNTKPEDWNRI